MAQEAAQGGGRRRNLREQALVRGSEYGVRFLLGAVLAGATVFGGRAPFALAMVACSGPGLDGFAALMGAAFGSLTLLGLEAGLRYTAAAVLIYAVAFAFFDLKVYRRVWFMPLVAAAANGCTGFVTLTNGGGVDWLLFATELLLTAAGTYFYRMAFSSWGKARRGRPLTSKQLVSLLILIGTALLSLVQLKVLGGGLSIGRSLAALGVMVLASQGGVGIGAAAGLCAGLALDLALGAPGPGCAAYGLAGLLTGVVGTRHRTGAAMVFVAGNALVSLWSWGGLEGMGALYDVFAASVLFLLLPPKLLCRVKGYLLPAAAPQDSSAAQQAERQLTGAAAGFRAVYQKLRDSFRGPVNEGDPSRVFDRAVERVCKGCALRDTCWQKDYQQTMTALGDALPPLLDRGRGEGSDFPPYFSHRCVHFPAFLTAVNQEVTAYLCRKQYQAQVWESRQAVCRQYGLFSQILSATALELAAPLVPTVERYKATLGVAARQKEGEAVSGDSPGWLRTEKGLLYVLLCDGMGSGALAEEESALAIDLLRPFLEAGVGAEEALSTLLSALALKNEADGGFTTIDLLELNLTTGECALYKLGGAPTYLKQNGAVSRFTASSLPAGLAGEVGPERYDFLLTPGDTVALVSDGVVSGGSDDWLQQALAQFEGDSPKELALSLVTAGQADGQDDRTAIVVSLKEKE